MAKKEEKDNFKEGVKEAKKNIAEVYDKLAKDDEKAEFEKRNKKSIKKI